MEKSTKVLMFGAMLTLACTRAQDGRHGEETFSMQLSRVFNAPIDQVWQAWTDSAMVKQWWGPEGFTTPVAKIDFKEGGTSIVCMRSPDGFDIYNSWTYTKIVPRQSIEFVQHFVDKDGNRLNPADIGLPPGIPEAVPHMIEFEDLGNGKTKITITESGYTAQETTEISKMGMQQCLDKMERLLANDNTGTRKH